MKTAIVLAIVLLLRPLQIMAFENVPANVTVPVEKNETEIVSVVLPIVEDTNIFNFFIDPQNFLFRAYAETPNVYVEEGANLLFVRRADDNYYLGCESDKLSVINKSTVPIVVTVTARFEGVNGLSLVEYNDFSHSTDCEMYLALIDDEGNELSLSEDGEVSFEIELDRAPLEAYAYEYDEATGVYRYACEMREIEFPTYSFGLKGSCNKDGEWYNITGKPEVLLSWNVVPLIEDKPEEEIKPILDIFNDTDSEVPEAEEDEELQEEQSLTSQTDVSAGE